MLDHIHIPSDGRGLRDVFVNGNKIDGVVFADTKKCVAVFMPKPYRVKKNSDVVYTRKLHGIVTVVSH